MAEARAADRNSVAGYSGANPGGGRDSMAAARAADRASVAGYSADARQPSSMDAASTASLANAYAEYHNPGCKPAARYRAGSMAMLRHPIGSRKSRAWRHWTLTRRKSGRGPSATRN
jgi:hypothetical protein